MTKRKILNRVNGKPRCSQEMANNEKTEISSYRIPFVQCSFSHLHIVLENDKKLKKIKFTSSTEVK